MNYISVCSGIEAATQAWEPLGWNALAFSEIEPFPSKVLAHHWPSIPNFGDMNNFLDWPIEMFAECDVLVGGCPCQAFSVAGLRNSLSDDRGNLTLTYARLTDHADFVRGAYGKPPVIIVYENVPGILSTKDNAFGCFLAALVGEDLPLEPPGGKWTNAGCVLGPKRTAAWRVLDAQYFGVAQRRRRVFLVASARKGFDPTAVLFEREGVRRDTAPSREAGQEITPAIRAGAPNGGAGHGARSGDSKDELIVPVCYTPSSINAYREGIGTLRANGGDLGGGSEGLICMAHGQAGAEVRSDGEPSLTCNHESPIVAFNWNAQPDQMNFSSSSTPALTCSQGAAVCQYGDVAGRHDSSPCADRGMNVVASVGFVGDTTPKSGVEVSPTIRADQGGEGRCVAFQTSQSGVRLGETHATLDSNNGSRRHNGVLTPQLTVRRLTPTECERLQGMEDGHTAIPGAADGPRYKAIGNSKAVPVVRWLGRRIAAALGAI